MQSAIIKGHGQQSCGIRWGRMQRRTMFPAGVAVFFIFFLSLNAYATTYYADGKLAANCTSGNYSVANRSCTGSNGNAYTTIQAAVAVALKPGDVVIVRAETYDERVTTKAAGSSGSEITIKAQAGETVVLDSATNAGFTVNHDYVILNGFRITGRATDLTAFIQIGNGASYVQVLKNFMSSSVDDTFYGIRIVDSESAHITIQGNTIDYIYYPAIQLTGSYHSVISNTISHTYHDAMRVFGHDHLIKNNTFSNMFNDGRTHVDIWQTFTNTDCTLGSYNITVEGNQANNCQAQIGNLKATSACGSNIHDWTFYNNVFNGVTNPINIYAAHVKFYNNTFYHSSTALAHPLRFTYDSSGNGRADYGEVKNNLFIYNGTGSGSTAGWYTFDANLVGFQADHNFVAGAPPIYPAKTGFNEANGINGGDPLFEDVSQNNFRLKLGSPAIDKGITATVLAKDKDSVVRPQRTKYDIGAYELHGLPAITNLRVVE